MKEENGGIFSGMNQRAGWLKTGNAVTSVSELNIVCLCVSLNVHISVLLIYEQVLHTLLINKGKDILHCSMLYELLWMLMQNTSFAYVLLECVRVLIRVRVFGMSHSSIW